MEDAKRELLRRAVELVGREELAKQLSVPEPPLEAWMRRLATMPGRKLLVLVDFLDRFGRPEK